MELRSYQIEAIERALHLSTYTMQLMVEHGRRKQSALDEIRRRAARGRMVPFSMLTLAGVKFYGRVGNRAPESMQLPGVVIESTPIKYRYYRCRLNETKTEA